MTDYHVYTGEYWNYSFYSEDYYYAILEKGVHNFWVSSIEARGECPDYTSTRHMMEWIANHFENESNLILVYPPYYNEIGLTVEKLMDDLPYKALKIIPGLNYWDLTNRKMVSTAHSMFGYAEEHDIPIFVNTNNNKYENSSAMRFEKFFRQYPNVKVILEGVNTLV